VIDTMFRRIWRGVGMAAAVGKLFLLPLTLPYMAGLWLSRRRIAGQAQFDQDIPVVIVGNVTVGGTGKTPVVAWLAGEVARSGRKAAIISRGYGGRRGRDPAVVSDGRAVRLSPAEAGDEPVMLARMLPGVPVVVGRDRLAAARLAVDRLGADVLLLDDGFQQRTRFPRALTVLTMNGRRPLGNGALLPAGPMREPVSVIHDADVLLPRGGFDRAWIEAMRAGRVGTDIIPWNYDLLGLRRLDGKPVLRPAAWLRGRRVLAASGIGDPEQFAAQLERWTGIGRVVRFDMPDHHRWTQGDVDRAMERAHAAACGLVVTTQKDAVKWPRGGAARLPVYVAAAGIRFPGRRSLRGQLRAYLRGFSH